jgi:heterogeneous nuclear ribonucleoprotein A1/A3
VENCKVFVGGLNYDTTEAGLKAFFEDHISEGNSIINMRIVRNHETGKSRGFAFVTFMSAEQKDKALELDGEKLDGRFIGVKPAVDKNR